MLINSASPISLLVLPTESSPRTSSSRFVRPTGFAFQSQSVALPECRDGGAQWLHPELLRKIVALLEQQWRPFLVVAAPDVQQCPCVVRTSSMPAPGGSRLFRQKATRILEMIDGTALSGLRHGRASREDGLRSAMVPRAFL